VIVDVPVLDRPRLNTFPLNLQLCLIGISAEYMWSMGTLSSSINGGKIGDDKICNGGSLALCKILVDSLETDTGTFW